MRLLHIGMVLTLATASFADTVTLKSGRVINGTYLGGSARQVRVEVGDRIETLDVSNVSRIEFGGSSASIQDDDRRPTLRRDNADSSGDRPVLRRSDSSDNSDDRPVLRRGAGTDSSDDRPVLRRNDDKAGSVILRPDQSDTGAASTAATSRSPIVLPAGTNLVIRMIEGVDSETASVGQNFKASLDSPVAGPNGETLIRRGADVVVKLVDSKESGKLTGKAELTLDLASIMVDGRMIDLNTQTVSRESASRGERTAKIAGGAAVAGAVLGGILGGGKGALGGAAAGGAAGAGVEAVTKGQRVRVPSETRLTFVLDSPVQI